MSRDGNFYELVLNFSILSCPDLNLIKILIRFDKNEELEVRGERVDPSSMEMMIFIY